jgi:Tol biopolymer transport system component
VSPNSPVRVMTARASSRYLGPMNGFRRTTAAMVITVIAILGASSLVAVAQGAPITKRVSVSSNGEEGKYGSDFPSVSADGRYVCFESLNKLTGGDAGVDDDVFVHDRKTGKTARASVRSNGKEPAGPSDSDSCSLSADGRLVAFRSDGALVGRDTNGYQDVYIHDMKTGKTTRASVKSDGTQVFADSQDPRISGNGRYVAWDTDGAFSGADVNGYLDVYRHDLSTGKTQQVSLRNNGSQPADGDSSEPSLSANGNKIAFQSNDGQMTADPDFQMAIDTDVFVRNMQTKKTVRASLSSNGDEPSYPFQSPPSNVNSDHPVISADGKLVAFHSLGVYNGSDDNLNYGDVFIRNLDTHKTSLVSLKSNGKQGTGESGYTDPHPIEMSHDGRFVAFDSLARLSPTDTDMVGDVYVRDRKARKTKLVTVTSSGKPRDKVDAALPALSANGKWVAFASADPYVGNDHNKESDIFERGPLF